jgi:hypothetical protein
MLNAEKCSNLAERVEFELSGDFLNGQQGMQKRQEGLKRLAARSHRKTSASLRQLYRAVGSAFCVFGTSIAGGACLLTPISSNIGELPCRSVKQTFR